MKYSYVLRTAAIGTLLTLAVTTYAETVSTIADLQSNKKTLSYIYARPMLDTMYRLAVEQDRKFGLQQDCKSKYRLEPYSIAVLHPIDFPDDKQHPVKGIWILRYQIQRCDESKFYNALFFAAGTGETSPAPRAYYPGATSASPLLIKDAMLAAQLSALAQGGQKDCKEIDVFDMRVTEKAHDVVDGGKTLRGVWGETWTFRLCGQMVDTAITFIPDATGGGTSFKVAPIKLGESAGKI
jgi:hypothetical protein